MIRVVHPGSGILIFTHPGSRGQKCTGSVIRIRNTVQKTILICMLPIVLSLTSVADPGCYCLHTGTQIFYQNEVF
jgi:hypothetical protein